MKTECSEQNIKIRADDRNFKRYLLLNAWSNLKGYLDGDNSFGRKRLNISVINVYDALEAHSTVERAAKELGCSRAYIYKVLKEYGRVNEQDKNRVG